MLRIEGVNVKPAQPTCMCVWQLACTSLVHFPHNKSLNLFILFVGLTLEQSTNLSLLHHKLDKLDRQFKELSISFKTRYVPKSRKEELKDALNDKVNQRDQLLTLSKQNRARQERLEIAVVAAQEYNRYKPPHQTVGDAVSLALARVAGEKAAALLEKGQCTFSRLSLACLTCN